MKRIYYIVIGIVFLGFSCGSSQPEATEEVITTDCKTASLSYQADILPIFESYCFECHNQEKYASRADGHLMNSYATIKALLDKGLIIGNIEHQKGFVKMPNRKKKLPDCEIAKIKAWVAEGAKEN